MNKINYRSSDESQVLDQFAKAKEVPKPRVPDQIAEAKNGFVIYYKVN